MTTMDVDPPQSAQPQPYAIVRIKRKRYEEPLDALVVEASPSRKKTKGGLRVFQYAGTVEQAAWNDEQQKQKLEKHIAGLAREAPQKKREDAPAEVVAPVDPVKATSRALSTAATTRASPGPPQYKRPTYQTPSKTYTIVPQEKADKVDDPYNRRRQLDKPPKVWSTRELEAVKKAAQVKMYEAVLSASDTGDTIPTSETDAEIEKFLPLLKDYLNVSEFAPAFVKAEKGDNMDEDYVYDVFFRHSTTFQDLSEAGSTNIAKLTGLPPELSGLAGEDDSDEEYSDEDDEDSNAEDWYTNDYPDEEESDRADDSSDEFHEASEAEDVLYPEERQRGAYRDVMADDF